MGAEQLLSAGLEMLSVPETSVAAIIGTPVAASTEKIDSNSAAGKRRIAERLIQKLHEAGFTCELALPAEDVQK